MFKSEGMGAVRANLPACWRTSGCSNLYSTRKVVTIETGILNIMCFEVTKGLRKSLQHLKWSKSID